MPDYAYKAVNQKGRVVRGVMAAANPEELYAKLTAVGCYPTWHGVRRGAAPFLRRKVRRRDLLTFTVHLATVLSSGAPILMGLQDLAAQTEEQHFREVVEDLYRNVEAGISLSQAMREHPEAFPEIYVSLVAAGETTGKLDQCLADLTRYLEWQEELSANIRQATIYPLMVFWAVTGLVALIFTVVLPKFLVIFEKSRVELPLPTRLVIAVSRFMAESWPLLLGGLAGGYLFLRLLRSVPRGRELYDRVKLALPVFGALNRKIILSRFAHTLASLYASGVNVLQALELIEKTGDNRVFELALRDVRLRVQEGRSMTDALKETGVFPPLFLRMVGVGEESGRLDHALEKLSTFYDREVPVTVKKVFGIMEPLIIVFLGGVVGTVAMSIFFPLYRLMQVTGG